MTPRWTSDDMPDPITIGFGDRLRSVFKLILLVAVALIGLIVLIPLRVIERPLFGVERPWSVWIPVWVCRVALWVIGLRLVRSGNLSREGDAFVANHASYMDILVLNAIGPMIFVSKDDVAGWPGVGWLARLTGTVFIARDPREAGKQREVLEARIEAGHRLLFFPEGTSTDGRQVIAFKSSLFAAFARSERQAGKIIQPIAVRYHPAPGVDDRVYGWWADMEFGLHFLQTLALPKHGRVTVRMLPPINGDALEGRKALAEEAENAVRRAFELSGSAIVENADEV